MPVFPLLLSSLVSFQVVAVETEAIGPLIRTVETVQAGPNPIDRFQIYHVRLAGGEGRRSGQPIILAPPLGTGFQFYENRDGARYEDSFAGFFAERGFDIWGFSQRVQDLPAGTCESGAADCSVMGEWGLGQLAGDAEYVRQRVAAESHRRPVIGGQSLGGMIGLAAVSAHPEGYAGLVAIDAALFSTDPAVTALAEAGCQALSGAVEAGVVYDAQQIQGLKALSALAAAQPAAPSPFFPPGFTNAQAWVTVLGTPNPGPTAPSPTFIFDAGDPLAGTLRYAKADYVHRGFAGFVDYLTFAEVRDVDCSLAGDDTFTAGLGAFTGPAFLVADGRGFGDMVEDTAALLGGEATLLRYPDLGHQDAFYAVDHRARLELPLLRWLEGRVPHRH
jgi:pimeloyl-ACP methyl ester carboxylesterase